MVHSVARRGAWGAKAGPSLTVAGAAKMGEPDRHI